MRSLVCLMATILMLCAPAVAAVAPSKIERVTVFTDQARVVRVAEVEIGAGLSRIQLEVTAFHVDSDSITARVFGAGELYGVQYRQVPVAQAPVEKIQGLEARLRDLRRELREVTDRRATVEKQRSFLDSFIDFAKIQVPRDIQTRLPDAAALEATLSFLERGYSDAHTRLQDLDGTIENLKRDIEQVERELGTLRGGDGRTLKVVEILFDSRRPQTVRVEAGYHVAGARWQPMYKAAVPDSADTVALTLLAGIHQKSGEDWEKVAVTISSAAPRAGGRLPDIHPWIVDVPRQPGLPGGREGMRTMAADKKTDAQEADAPVASAAPLAEAEVERSLLAVHYRLAQPVTVASQNQETIVPVFTRSLEGDFRHLAVPKRDPRAYFICRTRADGELLPGPLNVYFGDRFLGRHRLERMLAGRVFNLNLGVNRSVLVRREKTVDRFRETFFGRIERDMVVREVAYRIGLENTGDRDVAVDVLDHVPVSRTDRIRIEDIEFVPEPSVVDDQGRQGVLRWERTLAPGGRDEIEIRFTVIHPKDVNLPDF
jgi:uncharacterized protein (TIGR02231 family)